MKKGLLIGIVAGLLIVIALGGVVGLLFLRADGTEDRAEAQNVIDVSPRPQETDPVQPDPQPQPEPQTPPQPPQSAQDPDYDWVDVETEVSRIRAIYNDTVAGVSNGIYTQRDLGQGIQTYHQGYQLKCVVIPKGVFGLEYSRWYYYEYDELIFAYFEGKDSHRFYFYDDELMRWRYCADPTDPENAVNQDWGTSDEYQWWEDLVEEEGESFLD